MSFLDAAKSVFTQVLERVANFTGYEVDDRKNLLVLGGAALGAVAGGLLISEIGSYVYWRSLEKSHPFNGYTNGYEAMDNINLNNKICIVTGCNTGIGKETAKVLTKHGGTVIMACRSLKKAESARNDILNELNLSSDYNKLEIMILDLSSLDSVKTFANEFNKRNIQIDYLINNAAVGISDGYKTTQNGFEMMFGVNHLGHFYLVNLLKPSLLLTKSNGGQRARVINVSSGGEGMTDYTYNDILKLFEQGIETKSFYPSSSIHKTNYSGYDAYAVSKSANILFARQVVNEFGNNNIVSVSLEPGMIMDTELTRQQNFGFFGMLDAFSYSWKYGIMKPSFIYENRKTMSQGAATTLRCVSINDNQVVNGGWYHNCREQNYRVVGVSSKDNNDKLAKTLWTLSKVLLESKGHSI